MSADANPTKLQRNCFLQLIVRADARIGVQTVSPPQIAGRVDHAARCQASDRIAFTSTVKGGSETTPGRRRRSAESDYLHHPRAGPDRRCRRVAADWTGDLILDDSAVR